jgi:hypothetical protein
MHGRTYFERVARVPVAGTPILSPPRAPGRRWEPVQEIEAPVAAAAARTVRERTPGPPTAEMAAGPPSMSPAVSEPPTLQEHSPAIPVSPIPGEPVAKTQPPAVSADRARQEPISPLAVPPLEHRRPDQPPQPELPRREFAFPVMDRETTVGRTPPQAATSISLAPAGETPARIPVAPMEPVVSKPPRASHESVRPPMPAPAPPPAPLTPPITPRHLIEHVLEAPAGTMAKAEPPAIRIGSIEVVIQSPQPPSPPPAWPPVAQPASHAQSGMASGSLSRGFVSRYGFRQE